MAGRMTDATATAMENAAANESGAMNGFVGLGMAGGAMGGGFNAAQSLYNQGVQQQAQQQSAGGWKCSCGATATGKFCSECGQPKPQGPKFCSNCGAAATGGKFCSECGSPL